MILYDLQIILPVSAVTLNLTIGKKNTSILNLLLFAQKCCIAFAIDNNIIFKEKEYCGF